jgi:hypothetical protein
MSGRFVQRVTRDGNGRALRVLRVDRVTGDERELSLSKLNQFPDEEAAVAEPLANEGSETDVASPDGDVVAEGDGDAPAQAPAADYTVGYKRPPRNAAFKPGQSGNPKGRPKGQSLRSIFLSAAADGMDAEFAEYVHADPKGTKLEAAISALFRQAHYGDGNAIKQVLALQRQFVVDEPELSDESPAGD